MRIAGFEFAEGARFQPGPHPDPKVVGEHIELIRQRLHGEITPADIVNDARNPNSPLHAFFEWDDGLAAEQYRLDQARGLIRAVVAIYVSDNHPAQRVRAYVHIPEPGTPHYREVGHAMSQKKTRDMVLTRAWREFQQWRTRYADMAEFAELFKVADEIATTIRKKAG